MPEVTEMKKYTRKKPSFRKGAFLFRQIRQIRFVLQIYLRKGNDTGNRFKCFCEYFVDSIYIRGIFTHFTEQVQDWQHANTSCHSFVPRSQCNFFLEVVPVNQRLPKALQWSHTIFLIRFILNNLQCFCFKGKLYWIRHRCFVPQHLIRKS